MPNRLYKILLHICAGWLFSSRYLFHAYYQEIFYIHKVFIHPIERVKNSKLKQTIPFLSLLKFLLILSIIKQRHVLYMYIQCIPLIVMLFILVMICLLFANFLFFLYSIQLELFFDSSLEMSVVELCKIDFCSDVTTQYTLLFVKLSKLSISLLSTSATDCVPSLNCNFIKSYVSSISSSSIR